MLLELMIFLPLKNTSHFAWPMTFATFHDDPHYAATKIWIVAGTIHENNYLEQHINKMCTDTLSGTA